MNKLATLLGYFLALNAVIPLCHAEAKLRPWSIQDSIGVRYFVVDHSFATSLSQDDAGLTPVVKSPDNRYLFYLTRRGDLINDCVAFELEVFEYAKVQQALTTPMVSVVSPLRRVMRCSRHSKAEYAGIQRPRWVDHETIQFIGVDGSGPRSVFQLNVRSGLIKRLSSENHDVMEFFQANGSMVYSGRRVDALDKPRVDNNLLIRFESRSQIDDLLNTTRISYPLYSSFRGGKIQRFDTALGITKDGDVHDYPAVAISPDGRWAVMAYAPATVKMPASWRRYNKGILLHDKSSDEGARVALQRFMLIDLKHGTVRPLLDAPWGLVTSQHPRWRWSVAASPRALWAPDGRHVILVNTALPLNENVEERSSTAYIVDYDISTGSWSVVGSIVHPEGNKQDLNMEGAHWVKPGSELVVLYARMGNQHSYGIVQEVLYRLVDEKWKGYARAPSTKWKYDYDHGIWVPARPDVVPTNQGGLSFSLQQNANTPPALIATDGVRQITLTSSESDLRGIRWTPVQEVTWTESNGRAEKGGLMLPRASDHSSPPPLVIQIYYYEPRLFWPDGSSTTGYAAQPLASRGMAVLFMNAPQDTNEVATPREIEVMKDRIDAAVATLASQGLVDANRVGLVGFSRGGYMTFQAITHPGKTVFSAAVIADAYLGNFSSYLRTGMTSQGSDGSLETERQYGGGSFWENKTGWLKYDPLFNVEKITASTLFTDTRKASLPYAAEIVGAFRLNRRPIEYLIFEQGDHQLVRPSERFASLSATVDWMAFWLLGDKSAAPGKAEQYMRWRRMKEQQRALVSSTGKPAD